MAILTLTSSKNSITATVSGLDTEFAYKRALHWNISTDGSVKDENYRETTYTSPGVNSPSTSSFTFTNLSPKTTYYVYVDIMNDDLDTFLITFRGTTATTGIDIALWSWVESNGAASSAQTSLAYDALTTKGKINNFSYLVWNDLVNKIWQVCNYINEEDDDPWWPSYNLSFEETKMTYYDKTMTAARFNSARANVGNHYSTGIPEVSTGDPILGSYFIRLAEKLNEWINSLQ